MTTDEMLIDPVANWQEYCRTIRQQMDAEMPLIIKAFDSGVFDEVPSRSNRKKSGNVRRGGKNPRQ